MANRDYLFRAKADTSNYDANLAKAKHQLDGFAKANYTAGGAIKQLSSSLMTMAASYASVTAAIGAATSALRNNIQTAMGFEKSMSQLSSLTGMVGKDLEQLKDYAIELGSKTTLSASQVADAFKMIGSQQPQLLSSGKALKQVTQYAITLSEAAGIDLATAAQTLSTSINQMGGNSENAARYVNVLAAASQKGAGDIAWLGEALTKSATAAKAVGTDYEELVANLEQLAKAGFDASTAGTALRSIIMNLEKQSNSQFKPSIVGLTQAFENLGKANMDITGYQNIAGKLFATQAMAMANAAQEAKSMTEAITGTNTATEQAKTNTDNLDGALKSLASAWEGLNLHINDSNGFLREGVDDLTQTVRMVDELHTTLQSLDGILGTIGKGFKNLALGPLEALNAKIGLINFGLKYMQNLMSGATGIPLGTGSDAGAALGAAIGTPGTSSASSPAAVIASGSSKGKKTPKLVEGGIKGLTALDGVSIQTTESMKELRDQLSRFQSALASATNAADYRAAAAGISSTQQRIAVQGSAMRLGVSTGSFLDMNKRMNDSLRSQLQPITFDKVPEEIINQHEQAAKEVAGSWQDAAQAVNSVGSALAGLKSPAARVAGIVGQAIANIALGFSKAMDKEGDKGVWFWIASAASGLATMISTISAIKSATSGYADGGIVKGNTYSGDQIYGGSFVNAGELVLNRAQQSTLASVLQGGGSQGGGNSQPYVSGEQIYLGLNNYLARSGRGELITTR